MIITSILPNKNDMYIYRLGASAWWCGGVVASWTNPQVVFIPRFNSPSSSSTTYHHTTIIITAGTKAPGTKKIFRKKNLQIFFLPQKNLHIHSFSLLNSLCWAAGVCTVCSVSCVQMANQIGLLFHLLLLLHHQEHVLLMHAIGNPPLLPTHIKRIRREKTYNWAKNIYFGTLSIFFFFALFLKYIFFFSKMFCLRICNTKLTFDYIMYM